VSMLGSKRPTDADPVQEEMTLTEHLAELRMRIIRAGLSVFIGALLVFAFYNTVLGWLLEPYSRLCAERYAAGDINFCGTSYDPATGEIPLISRDPLSGLATRLKIASYGGIILALPVVLWQLWRFVVPALHKHERRHALGFVLSSTLLFLVGGVIAFSTLGKSLEFLISWAGDDVIPQFEVQPYIRLITLMVVAFGVGFTVPVMLVFLQLLGVVQPRTLLGGWRYAIVGTFLIAAVITPSGDPYSLLALSVPMIVLYFVAIGIGWLNQRRKRRAGAG
jgi:sec-independent protein translocase protein TatC